MRRACVVVLVLGIAGGAITQLWQLHTREVSRQSTMNRLRLHLAEAAAASGDVVQACRFLRELDDEDAVDPARVAAVSRLCGRQERCANFLRQAGAVRAGGAHVIDDSGGPDPIADACTAALGIFAVRDDPLWTQALDGVGLGSADEVREEAADLLTLLALRRLVATGNADAVRSAAREALECLRQADLLRPTTSAAQATRRACYRRLGDDVEADALGRIPPRSADDFYTVGFLAEHDRVEEITAAEAYRQALVLNPGHFGAHVGRFTLARRQGDLQTQITELTACLALRPTEPSFFFHRGFARFRLDDYPAALDDWNVGLSLRPEGGAYYWRGRVHFLAGRWRDANADFTAALQGPPEKKVRISLAPERPSAPLAWRALARARLGRHREAADDAEQALKLRADAETAWFAARTYSLCLRATKDLEPCEREELAQRYGARSVALLREAIARGLTRIPGQREGLRASPDLDPVRGRRDFEDLLRAVDERK